MRLAVKFSKDEPVMFVSHLDVLRLFQRAFKRAKLPLAYSQGFNPHPLLSFATALSVGMTSRCEYLDVTLERDIDLSEFKEKVRAALPEGVDVIEVFDLGDSRKSLTSAMKTAAYSAFVRFDRSVDAGELNVALSSILAGEIVIMKKTKGGVKPTDIRPMVISACLEETGESCARFGMKGVLTASGGLNPEAFLAELFDRMKIGYSTQIERTEIELDRELLM